MLLLILNLLNSVISIILFVLWIIVLVKTFQQNQILMGILGIITCGLVTFVWGWIKVNELKLQKIMIIWTVLLLIHIGLTLVTFIIGASNFLEEFNKLNRSGHLTSEAILPFNDIFANKNLS